MRRLLSGVLLGAFLLAGCGIPAAVAPATPAAPVEVVTPFPVSVSIPDLGVESTLIPLHLDNGRRLEAPPVTEPMQAGWYGNGVHPGDVGPAVIAGHVSGRLPGADHSIPGIFAHLADLKPGALVHVPRDDGSTVTFRVERVETHEKDDFPTLAVYGDTPGPALRLITCGGEFDPDAHSYRSNVVVFATMI